jgi:hypothetical protein
MPISSTRRGEARPRARVIPAVPASERFYGANLLLSGAAS